MVAAADEAGVGGSVVVVAEIRVGVRSALGGLDDDEPSAVVVGVGEVVVIALASQGIVRDDDARSLFREYSLVADVESLNAVTFGEGSSGDELRCDSSETNREFHYDCFVSCQR